MTIDHCITDLELVDQTHGDLVSDDHRGAIYARTLRHPTTNEHLISVVPSTHEVRRMGGAKYRVVVPGKAAGFKGGFNSLKAAEYAALAHAIEAVEEREEVTG